MSAVSDAVLVVFVIVALLGAIMGIMAMLDRWMNEEDEDGCGKGN